MFGSPLHWGAKGMSIIVGAALIAAAVLAFVNEDSALGIFAANGLTELVWLAAGALLLLLALLPRVGRARTTTTIAAAARSAASPRSASSSARAPTRIPARPRGQLVPPLARLTGSPGRRPVKGRRRGTRAQRRRVMGGSS